MLHFVRNDRRGARLTMTRCGGLTGDRFGLLTQVKLKMCIMARQPHPTWTYFVIARKSRRDDEAISVVDMVAYYPVGEETQKGNS